jgi:Fe-S-cluster containining protein
VTRAKRRRGPTAETANHCRACGLCCELYGDALAAEESDLSRWRREGREDLLRRVGEGGSLWNDPVSGDPLPACPFLRYTDAGGALCSIHETKPDMCRDYPGDGHGTRCAAGLPFEEEGD